MRLICPSCEANYEVDDRVIPDDGRDVQCSNCGHTWFQKSAAMLAEEAETEASEAELNQDAISASDEEAVVPPVADEPVTASDEDHEAPAPDQIWNDPAETYEEAQPDEPAEEGLSASSVAWATLPPDQAECFAGKPCKVARFYTYTHFFPARVERNTIWMADDCWHEEIKTVLKGEFGAIS